MRIGITGHQARIGIEWPWLENTIRVELVKIRRVELCLSSLAAGSDQVFAEVALRLRIPVLAVIPIGSYERHFSGDDLVKFRKLLSQCDVMRLDQSGVEQRAFLEAGKKIVELSSMVFAVWDGERAEGKGGTADIVEFAQQTAKPILHINPIARSIVRINWHATHL
jgi:hypothetical protein